jgi:calcineurin-like phosphoesterase
VVNLIGRTFFASNYDCPFRAMDNLLAGQKQTLDYYR